MDGRCLRHHDRLGQRDILHQCRTCSGIYYFRNGTTHIYIDYIRLVIQYYFHSLCHEIGFTAEKLYRHRSFLIRYRAKFSSFSVAIADTFRRYHFAYTVCTAVLSAHKTVCPVRNTRHWCKTGSLFYFNISYFNHLTSFWIQIVCLTNSLQWK